MSLTLLKYESLDNTLQNIQALVNRHYTDPELHIFDNWNIKKIFNYISKKIPYVADPTDVPFLNYDTIELLKSPVQTMLNGGDCDDKHILAAAIFKRRNLPTRYAVVSTKPSREVHHIYLEIYFNGTYVPFDCTYNYNQLFYEKIWTKKILYTYDPVKNSMNSIEVTPENIDQLYNRSVQLAGDDVLGGGVRLAILEGNDKRKKRGVKLNDIWLLGDTALGMVDPATVIAVGVAAVRLFSSIFGSKQYIDAYHVWEQATKSIGNINDPNNWQNAATQFATIAILGVDIMNPPYGKNYCTSQDHCGNRAEWEQIQPTIQSMVQEIAPFFYWYIADQAANNSGHDFSMTGLYAAYNDYKTKGNYFNQYKNFLQTGKLSPSSSITAGISPTMLGLGAAALLAYLIA